MSRDSYIDDGDLSPYTAEEWQIVSQLIQDAADEDPGEENEP